MSSAPIIPLIIFRFPCRELGRRILFIGIDPLFLPRRISKAIDMHGTL